MFAQIDPAAFVQPLKSLHAEDLLLPVLIQLVVIVVVARGFGILLRKVGQPTVIGEVIAGILMGPSLFGLLAPELFDWVFKPQLPGIDPALTGAALPKIFDVLAQVGLIFLLFLIGLEFEFGHLRTNSRAAIAVAVVGIAVPFGLGAGMAPLVHGHLEPHPTKGPIPLLGMTLFLGTALSITAIPVLGRIMLELGITRTKLATVTITAAAIGDAVGWILLASVAAVAKAAFDPTQAAVMVVQTVAFTLAMVFLVRPALIWYFRGSLARNQGQLSLNAMAVLLAVLLVCALVTNRIGIFAIFGAFLLGAVLSGQHQLREAVTARMRDFVTSFFLPIFFTYTGLRTEIGSLTGATMWLICGAVVVAAIVGKVVGCGVAARLNGFSAKESSLIGVMMNTRGLVELIVINVGYDLGVIPKSLFCVLVLMAIVTTVMTSPLVLRLRHGTELEEPIRQSGFVRD